MGKYIGQDITYGYLEKQEITVSDPTAKEYELNRSVVSATSILVVCERAILEPLKDYVVVLKSNGKSAIRLSNEIDLSTPQDGTLSLYVVFLGAKLLIPGRSDDDALAPIRAELSYKASMSEVHTYVDYEIEKLVNAAPTTLDTLKELSDALGSDKNFSTTISNQIGNITNNVSSLNTSLSNEVSRATSAEASLASDISSEAAARSAADVTLQGNIDAEETRAMGAEADLADDLADEAAARAAADTVLQDNIDAEETRAMAAEAALQSEIDALSPVATSGSYTDLTDKPDLSVYALASNLTQETSDRQSQDLALESTIQSLGIDLQTNIDSKESALYSALSAETLARISADDTLSSRVTSLEENPPVASLANLSDVQLTTPQQGQLLVYDGQNFINTNTITTDQGFSIQTAGSEILASVGVEGDFSAKRYSETISNSFTTTLTPSSGTLIIDTGNGNTVLGTLSASVTTWAFTNVPTDLGKSFSISVIISGNSSYTYGDACSVNGVSVSGGIKWSGGGATPVATNGTDILSFIIARDSSGTIKVFGSASTNFV